MNYKCKVRLQYADSATRKVVRSEVVDGILMGFSTDFHEFESGAGNYPIAIVLMKDGTIATVTTDCIFDIEHPFCIGGIADGHV